MTSYMLKPNAVAIIRARCPELVSILDDQDAIDNPPDRQALIERARDEYAIGSSNNIEVDDDAQLSPSDNGCWVQGWLWLYEPDEPEFEQGEDQDQGDLECERGA